MSQDAKPSHSINIKYFACTFYYSLSCFISGVVFWGILQYRQAEEGRVFGITDYSAIMGYTAIVTLGLAFGLKACWFFWKKLGYVKSFRGPLAVAGYFWVVLQVFVELFLILQFDASQAVLWYGAVLSVFVVLATVFVYYRYVEAQMTEESRYNVVRLIYYGVLITIPFIIWMNGGEWYQWFFRQETILPPFSLLLCMFLSFILGMRLRMEKLTHR